MSEIKYLDKSGLQYLLTHIKDTYQKQETGKGLSSEDFTSALKAKLEGISAGAEVNQNAFAKVIAGEVAVEADAKSDTLTVTGSNGVTVTGNASTDTITISNSGVRSIASGGTDGTISVNTNGTSADVAVTGFSALASSVSALSTSVSNMATSGTANTANKLANTTAIGGASRPVYFTSAGVPATCSFTVSTSVPANAVFTDHITTATDSGTGNGVASVVADANGALTVTKTQFATEDYVEQAISDKLATADAMTFKGVVAKAADLPATHNAGDTYKVSVAGTYAGVKCEVGDMIICITDGTVANNAHWTVVQANIDGAVTGPASATDLHIAVFNSATGKIIKDGGKTIADITYSHPTHTTAANGLYKVTVDGLGHVTSTTAVAKADITSLGIPAQDTTYEPATTAANGLMTSAMVTKLNGIASGANAYTLPNATTSTKGGVIVGSNISVNSGTISLTSANVTAALGYTPPTTNTTYSVATTAANGLMSSAMVTKLNGIQEGATSVSVSATKTSGVAIGTVTVNGTATTLYCNSNSDTKNTAGATSSTATKLLLIGATSNGANPQTYANPNCYVGTDNCLYSGGAKVITDISGKQDAMSALTNGEIDIIIANA